MPSLRRLARDYALSKRTVERALAVLREEGHCRRRGRGRLVAARADTGIRLDGHLVLEVLSDPLISLRESPHFLSFQQGLEQGLAERYAPLLLVHDGYLRSHLPPRLLEQDARGVILYGRFQKQVLKRYAASRMPVVLCDLPPGGLPIGALSVDNESSAYDATRRLIRLGHRRIAFQRLLQLTQRDVDWDARERQRGYEAALREAKIKPRSAWIFNSLSSEKHPARWMRQLLKTAPPLSALLANNPPEAEGLRVAAEKQGRRVPHDLSIVCFQGRQPMFPGLSGPRIDFFAMGQQAVEKVFDAGQGRQHERLPTIWHPGRTLGVAR